MDYTSDCLAIEGLRAAYLGKIDYHMGYFLGRIPQS